MSKMLKYLDLFCSLFEIVVPFFPGSLKLHNPFAGFSTYLLSNLVYTVLNYKFVFYKKLKKTNKKKQFNIRQKDFCLYFNYPLSFLCNAQATHHAFWNEWTRDMFWIESISKFQAALFLLPHPFFWGWLSLGGWFRWNPNCGAV